MKIITVSADIIWTGMLLVSADIICIGSFLFLVSLFF